MVQRKKILITGDGWIGNKFADFLGAEVVKTDIANESRMSATIEAYKPDILLNTAGRAGPPTAERGLPGVPNNIDWCGLTASNRQKTWYANVDGPTVLASLCNKRGIRLVHLSSGCIFDGMPMYRVAWHERDIPCPVSYYAETKVRGEAPIREIGGLILRIRMPVDAIPHERNLITKLVRYPEMLNAFNSITMIESLLVATRSLIQREATGIYHVSNPVAVTHKQIMRWYREIVDPSHETDFVTQNGLLASGKIKERRSNCVLDTSKLQKAGVVLSEAPKMIRSALQVYAHELRQS